jgi:hypothetical protein
MKAVCIVCQQEFETRHEGAVFCGWDCHVDQKRKEGAKVFAPNNLYITCIRGDGALMEHEHADHKDYKFPVQMEYEGQSICTDKCTLVGGECLDHYPEAHALLYSDGYVAITLHEHLYYMWEVETREQLPYGVAKDDKHPIKISKVACDKIKALYRKVT